MGTSIANTQELSFHDRLTQFVFQSIGQSKGKKYECIKRLEVQMSSHSKHVHTYIYNLCNPIYRIRRNFRVKFSILSKKLRGPYLTSVRSKFCNFL